jgi:hypothetical protein
MDVAQWWGGCVMAGPSTMGSDNETFWVSTSTGRSCKNCGNHRVQYLGRMVDYKGSLFVKPLGKRKFCVQCSEHRGRAPIDMFYYGIAR